MEPSAAVFKDRTLEQVWSWLARQDPPVYVAGGSVRDLYLGRPVYDLDLAIPGSGLDLARRLADRFGGAYFALDEERLTGRALVPRSSGSDLVVDVATFRGTDLASDLAGRDFTINAMALDVRQPDLVLDPHGGLADLAAGLIRPVSDASIRHDALRALRAVRQAAQLNLRLAPETEALIRRDGAALKAVAQERIRDELVRILERPESAPWIRYLDDLGLLTVTLPELEPLRGLAQPLPHRLDALSHTLAALAALEGVLASLAEVAESADGAGEGSGPSGAVPGRGGLLLLAPYAVRLRDHVAVPLGGERPVLVTLKLAALLHDTGKAAAHTEEADGRVRFLGHDHHGAALARAAVARLRLTTVEARRAETVVRHHMRPLLLAAEAPPAPDAAGRSGGPGVTSRAVYRYFRDTGDAGVDILLLALADHRATYPRGAPASVSPALVAVVKRMMSDYFDHRPERVTPPPLIRGHDLIRLGLDPGPTIGRLLESVREAQASGEVTTREEALGLARRLIAP